jgi:hypothetical protein
MVKRIIELIPTLGLYPSLLTVAQGAETPESQEDAIGRTPPTIELRKR